MAKDTQQTDNHNSLLMLIIIAVLLLAAGQFVLYRNMQNIKTMISETSIEIKEGKGVKTIEEMQEKNQEQTGTEESGMMEQQ